jgi:hypothetical protein
MNFHGISGGFGELGGGGLGQKVACIESNSIM